MSTPQPDATTKPRSETTAASSMTAIVQHEYGDAPEDVFRLEEVPKPTIRDDEVLVRVRASSVDRGTWHMMAGVPYLIRGAGFGLRRPKRLNPGRNLAGTVEVIGKQVAGFDLGDEVFGTCDDSFAEYARVRTDRLSSRPMNVTFEEAAAVPVSGLTALQGLRDHGKVQAGQKVLVIGASGGVGTFAVQIAKAMGAEVTGVCSTSKVDLVRSLGADYVVDYTRHDFLDGQRKYDVILDTGGHRRVNHLRRALTPKGRLVLVGSETDGRWLSGLDRTIRALLLSPFVGQKLGTFISPENTEDLTALRELIESGKVKPVVDRTFPLSETAAAVRYLMDNRARGKIAITLQGPEQ
jgi:NADPH:quinone reductase-like Zn-dependent oxidoreductase